MILKRKTGNTAENRKQSQTSARERQRRKLMRTKYGQARKKHARKGVQSCFYAGAAFVLLLFLLVLSFVLKGQMGFLTGFAGIAVLALAVAGLEKGVRGLKERDKDYITCRVGIGGSILLLLGMCAIFIRGLF